MKRNEEIQNTGKFGGGASLTENRKYELDSPTIRAQVPQVHDSLNMSSTEPQKMIKVGSNKRMKQRIGQQRRYEQMAEQ